MSLEGIHLIVDNDEFLDTNLLSPEDLKFDDFSDVDLETEPKDMDLAFSLSTPEACQQEPSRRISQDGSDSGLSGCESWDVGTQLVKVEPMEGVVYMVRVDTPPDTPPQSASTTPPPLAPPTFPCHTIPCQTTYHHPLPIYSPPLAVHGTPQGKVATIKPKAMVEEVRVVSKDEVVLKRQQRMIRNRESASLSRKRRKEQMQLLEDEVLSLRVDNKMLRSENERLRGRLEELQGGQRITNSGISRGGIVLCMFAFLLILNVVPFNVFQTDVLVPQRVEKSKYVGGSHKGRALLWVNGTEEGRNTTKDGKKACKDVWVNSTESLRLEEELRHWASRITIKGQPEKTKGLPVPSFLIRRFASMQPSASQPNAMFNSFNFDPDSPPKATLPRRRTNDLAKHIEVHPSELYSEIRKRNDTFYFVSFSGDHLLMSAQATNGTHRPKMSFLMPAFAKNETLEAPEERIAMMQIDCEVTNTKLVYLKKSLIPKYYKKLHRK